MTVESATRLGLEATPESFEGICHTLTETASDLEKIVFMINAVRNNPHSEAFRQSRAYTEFFSDNERMCSHICYPERYAGSETDAILRALAQ